MKKGGKKDIKLPIRVKDPSKKNINPALTSHNDQEVIEQQINDWEARHREAERQEPRRQRLQLPEMRGTRDISDEENDANIDRYMEGDWRGGKRRTRKKKVGGGVACSKPGGCNAVPNSIDDKLVRAIEEQNPNKVKKYLDGGANENVLVLDRHLHLPENVRPAPEEVPAIIYAARHIETSEIMKHLIDKGASVEQNHFGTTPLIEAAEYGNQLAVEYLLSIGVNINDTTENGVPAIAYAVLNEDIDMINFMLEKRKGEIDFNYTVFGTDNENVIDDAVNGVTENKEVAKILKEYAIEQPLQPHMKRQRDRVNLGNVVRKIPGKSSSWNKRKMPLDITRMMEGEKSAKKRWDPNSYLGGKRRTHKKKGGRIPYREPPLDPPEEVYEDDFPDDQNDQNDRLDATFEEGLHQTIFNICLSYAIEIAENPYYNSDSDSDTGSEDNTPITQMTDEQLRRRAVFNELVYGEYDTGHIGFLQQFRDFGTIGRLTRQDRNRIYEDIHTRLRTWLNERNREIRERDSVDENNNIIKFYSYVASDILKKIRIAFGIEVPRMPERIPTNSGGKRKSKKLKRKKRTRKKKGSGGVLGVPANLTTPPSSPRRSNEDSPVRPVKKMQRTPPRKTTNDMKEQRNSIKTLTEYLNDIKETRANSPPPPETHETLRFGGKKTRKRKGGGGIPNYIEKFKISREMLEGFADNNARLDFYEQISTNQKKISHTGSEQEINDALRQLKALIDDININETKGGKKRRTRKSKKTKKSKRKA